MDPYLSSCLLLMAIMSTLVSYIYGSSVGIQVRKTKIWPSLALEVTLGKFSFSQVKKHISAHNFCNGQKFQCSISGPKYWCAVIWCRVRTSGDRMYQRVSWFIIMCPGLPSCSSTHFTNFLFTHNLERSDIALLVT